MVKEILDCRFNRAIGVDLEYHTVEKGSIVVALLQISSAEKDYVVDTLQPALRPLLGQILAPVFENPDIIKIFHGCGTDIPLLAVRGSLLRTHRLTSTL